jgi:uncharacterized membrane protein/uncharacterized protein YwbE
LPDTGSSNIWQERFSQRLVPNTNTPVNKKEKVMNQESATNHASKKLMSAAALGAVAMYILDPDRGRRRRALARDKVESLWAKADDAVAVTTRDLGNRLRGLRIRISHMLSLRKDDVSDDNVLAARVRAKIGRAVSHPHAIKVAAHQGRVTLSGPILAHEKRQLLDVVRKVPGVAEVEDNLEIHERPDISSLQGEGKRRELRPALLQENWPPALRATAALGGGVLTYYGVTRRSPASAVLTAFGLGLMMRSIINMPLKRILGFDTEKPPIHLEKSIYVAAPPEVVFDIWSNYENFPHFMSNVEKVRDLGNGRSHWIVNGPAGTQVEWDAVLTEFVRPELLAWKSEPNSTVQHVGRIRFKPANGGTRVYIQMSYSPPAGVLGHMVASLFNGDPKKQMDEDLLRMKTFIERGIPPHDAAKPIRQPSPILH